MDSASEPILAESDEMRGYTVTYAAEGDIAEVRFRERVLAETILPVVLELKRYPDYHALTGVLWDLTDADLSHLTMTALAEVFRSKNAVEPSKPLRIACVVSAEIDTHILRLWAEGFDDDKPISRRWFLDRKEAITWIRRPGGETKIASI